ncbi:GDP-mannose 4,6-dehydratase [Roseococcus thiosulfatophilus]|uniref:GDP-mannose 4,6-dehydratase n=1 Tax=Roseococcus thiosulfatophilus TaxID=35813 RepID=UPI001A905A3D|nr:GDP-mannose 4,6-dehydratase [Roseococcus thiosulfatophilus]
MKRILVTGASGFVGRHLLPVLRACFPAARLLGARHGAALSGWDEAVDLPLEDSAALRSALTALRPEGLVHLAALSSVGGSFQDPLAVWEVNLGHTLRLAEAVRVALPECRCVFASTAEVYGLSFQGGLPLDEDAPMRPANPYAASKAAADLAVGEAALRGLRALRLRPFNHSGPGQAPAFVLPAFARQVARIEAGLQPPVMEVGALDRWRDMLDVRDVCRAYALALDRFDALPNGAAFNLATGHPQRIADLLEALRARATRPIEIRTSPGLLRPTDVPSASGNPRAARDLLGWAPEFAIEQTLESVLADWRARAPQEA